MTNTLLEKVGKWKMEASREDMLHLFYPVPELPSIIGGESVVVVGRKGVGKTAIAEHILSTTSFDIFKDKLSFKDFPFHVLYQLSDEAYKPASQYISLWRFLIYSSITRMMGGNNSISPEARDMISKKFPDDSSEKINRTISNWVSKTFEVNILGTGGSYSETRSLVPHARWSEEVDALRDFTKDYIDNSTYYILFDALDDDYKEINSADDIDRYINLISGLIKAAVSVHDDFSSLGKRVFPVVFIRSDIFELIKDNDRNKWRDVSVRLKWRIDSLQRMLAHRISKTEDKDGPVLSFPSAWRRLYTGERIDIGDKIIEQFDYINFRTMGRPRDHIFYVMQSSKVASQKGWNIIRASTTINGELEYSEYLKQELVDEVGPLVPQIDKVLLAISRMNKGIFYAEDFYAMIDKMAGRKEIDLSSSIFGPEKILDLLYRFDIIGNRSSTGHTIYRRSDSASTIDYDRQIVLHVGLLRSLQIGNPRKASVVP